MKRPMKFLMRLYPKGWRARYGEEFEALIEDAPLTWSGVFDLLKGAIRMQLSIPNFPRLALILSVAGLALGFGASFLVTPVFVSTSEMAFLTPQVNPVSGPHRNLADLFLQLQNEILSRTSLSAVIQDPRLDLYKAQRVNTPLEDVIERMRHDVRIQAIEKPGMSGNEWLGFEVRFRYSDPRKTQAVVQTLITKFQETNLYMQREQNRAGSAEQRDEMAVLETRIAALEQRLGIARPRADETFPYGNPGQWRSAGAIRIETIDPPSLPELPVAPNRAIFAVDGFGAGLVLAILLAVFRRRTDLRSGNHIVTA
jgi:hypothetical protein